MCGINGFNFINKPILKQMNDSINHRGPNAEGSFFDKNISNQAKMIVCSAPGTKEKEIPSAKREKQKLADKEILQLAKICLMIEKHYGCPQDIEWAYAGKKIYIVQSRPITTL